MGVVLVAAESVSTLAVFHLERSDSGFALILHSLTAVVVSRDDVAFACTVWQ